MGWVVNATPWPLYPRERDPVPLYRRLGGPSGRSKWVWKISPPPGFDLRSVHPLASRYTDWTLPAHCSRTVEFWRAKRPAYIQLSHGWITFIFPLSFQVDARIFFKGTCRHVAVTQLLQKHYSQKHIYFITPSLHVSANGVLIRQSSYKICRRRVGGTVTAWGPSLNIIFFSC